MTTGPEELSLNYLLDPAFQLVNTAGRPLTNGWIEVYYHGTRDKYYCASDFDGTLHPFKIPLDSLGSNIVLADPNFSYDIYVYNSFGSLQMSRYNVNPGSGSGGGSSGEGGPAEHWSSDTAGGASTTVTGGTTVYLTLPSSEDQPEFVDHTTDTAIFLKEGLYHIDAVVSFKQDDEDLQNIIKDLVVNTGLIGWDAQMTGQKNWTGPESTDDDRHFLELHTVVSVPEDLLQPLYFQIASPVDLDSAAIEKLDIVKLEAGGNGIKYAAGYGIDITGQVISTSGMMPESSAANFVDIDTYNTDIENIYETIAETSAMIPSGVATEQWVTDYVSDATSAFITSADIPDIPEDLVTSAELASVSGDIVSQIPSLDGYATEQFVEDYTSAYITSGDLPVYTAGNHIDITDHEISVDGVSGLLAGEGISITASDGNYYINNIGIVPADVVTSGELATVSGEIVNQIPSLDGYATEEYVQENTSAFITEDALDGYATQQWVEGQHYITSADIPDVPEDVVTSGQLATVSGEIINQIPDTSDMATKTWVGEQGYLTSIPEDLVSSGELATVSGNIMNEIPDTSDMATKTWVGQQGYLTSVPAEYATSGDLVTLSGAIEAEIPSYTAGENISIINDEISVSGTAGLIAGENISITASGDNYVISSTGGGGSGSTYYAGDHIVIDQNNYISTSGLMVENSAFMIDSAGYANRVTEGGAAGTLNLGTIVDNAPLQVTGLQDDVEYTLNCSGSTDGVQIYQGSQWGYQSATTKYPTNNEIKFTKSDFDLISSTGNYYLRFVNPYSGLIGNNATLSYGGSGGTTNTRYALVTDLPSTGQLIPAGGTSGQVVTKTSTGPVWLTPFQGVYSGLIGTTPNSVEVVTALPVSPVAGRIYLIPES